MQRNPLSYLAIPNKIFKVCSTNGYDSANVHRLTCQFVQTTKYTYEADATLDIK